MSDRNRDPASPRDHVDWDGLARYLAGESSPDEAEEMRRWLDTRPDRAELVAALDRSIARVAYRPSTDLDVESALRRVHTKMRQADARPFADRANRTPPRPFAPVRARWTIVGLRAAAVLAAVAAGTTIFWQSRERDGRETPAVAQMHTTGVGERDSLRLPDGTRVVLGPGSRLAVDRGYGTSHREVGLRGEAYFDAQHDGAHPFTVRAGNATVRDVGTRFSVHSNPGDGVRVAVTSGAVVLKAHAAPGDSGVMLQEGDRGVLHDGGQISAERGAVTEEDLAWTRGQLVFRDAPLTQVRADLRRWYGIELDTDDATLAGKHVTTTFDGEPVQRVIEVLALILGADVQHRGNTVVLRARSR